MDLILFNTPIHDYSQYPKTESTYTTPLGLLYLHAYVTDAGFSCEVVDAEAEKFDFLQAAKYCISKKPKFIGFNAFSVNYSFIKEICTEIQREHDPIIIIGGPHATLSSDKHIRKYLSFSDFVIQGSGEYSLVDLLSSRKRIENGKRLILPLRNKEKPTILSSSTSYINLDETPHPTRGTTRFEPYIREGLYWADISISRGCKFNCAFCSGSSRSSGIPYSKKSMERVIDELKNLKQRYNIEGIEIVDDLPFRNKKEIYRFFELMCSNQLKFKWEFNLPISIIRSLTKADIEHFKKEGFHRLSYGVESGDENIRRIMGKKSSEKELLKISRLFSSYGIAQKLYFIIGFPGESAEESCSTIDLAKKLRRQSEKKLVSPRIFIYKPFPGSSMWQELVEQYTEECLYSYVDYVLGNTKFNKHAWGPTLKLSHLPVEELIAMVNEFYSSY